MPKNNAIDKLRLEFFLHSAEMLCIASGDGYFVDLNPRWSEILGYSEDELKSKPFIEFVHPDDRQATIREAEAIYGAEGITVNFENRYIKKDGSYMWLAWNTSRVGDYLFASARDITFLKEQQIYYQDLQESAQIGYWQIDLQTGTPVWSEKTYDIHDVPRGAEIDMSKALDFYPGEARALIEKRVQDGIANGTPWDEEIPFLTAKARRLWVRAIGKPTMVDGKVEKLHGTFQDITNRKTAELRAKYLLDTVGDGFFDWYIQEDFEYMSPRFWDILGFKPEEKRHHPSEWQKLIFEEDLKVALENFNLHVSTKGKHPFAQECRYRHKDGSTVWVVCQGKVVEWDQDSKPIRMVGSHTDITKLKEVRERLSETAKLASLGEVAGGIAHEINNPLAIISSNASLIKILSKKGLNDHLDKHEKAVDTILATVKRISKIIDGMKLLVRDQATVGFKVHDFKNVIEEPISLCLENMKSKCIEPKIEIDQSDLVLINATQLSQIVLNLVGNAIDAVDGTEDPWIKVTSEVKGDVIRLYIIDSGSGIPKEILKRMFEPFYTTKEVGKGTGLGLSISKEIMEKHGGRLFYDEKHENTCFCIELPIQQTEVS